MQLSIIIPIYNVEKYLPQCLDSIINQSFKDFEIICIDDCSTDNSLNIAKKYEEKDSRIRVLHNEINLGLGIARNKGLKIAQGEYVHFVDSDDWIEKDSYAKIFNKLDSLETKPDILFFRHRHYDELTGVTKEIPYNNKQILNIILNPQEDADAIDNWDRYAWCKLHKRSFLISNNIFYNDYHCMEDVEQAALVYTQCRSIYYTDDIVVNYRVNRKNSLVLERRNCLIHIIKSFENNRIVYQNVSDNIKYKLLGFDYCLVKEVMVSAYNNGLISFFTVIFYVLKVNTKDVKNYVYNYLPSGMAELKISLLKMFLRKHFVSLFYFLVKLKKRLNIW